MEIQRTSDSCTAPTYRITYGLADEAQTVNQLIDLCEPFNYGGRLLYQTDREINIQIYVD